MKDIMVKMDGGSHTILKKWKKKFRDKKIKVSLGAAIREMDTLLKDKDIVFSKTDLKTINIALGELKEISKIYDKPSFSGVIVKMDSMIKEMNDDTKRVRSTRNKKRT